MCQRETERDKVCCLDALYSAVAKSLQSCPPVQPHRRQPTRLPRPWDSPGKNTGVGCHFLLQCMKVKSESEVTQLCQTLHHPMDCSLPGSSVHGIFQARALPLPSPALYSTWYFKPFLFWAIVFVIDTLKVIILFYC